MGPADLPSMQLLLTVPPALLAEGAGSGACRAVRCRRQRIIFRFETTTIVAETGRQYKQKFAILVDAEAPDLGQNIIVSAGGRSVPTPRRDRRKPWKSARGGGLTGKETDDAASGRTGAGVRGAGWGRRCRASIGAARAAGRALLLSEGRYSRLHQGSVR